MAKKKELNNPKEMFLQAEALFNSAYALSHRTYLHENPYLEPIMNVAFFNHAFSCEIYLKCLLCIDELGYERDHDLEKLFESLDDHRKEDIKKSYEHFCSKNDILQGIEASYHTKLDRNFSAILKKNSQAFINFRYSFALDSKKKVYNLSDVVLAVREVIRHIHPEWPILEQPSRVDKL